MVKNKNKIKRKKYTYLCFKDTKGNKEKQDIQTHNLTKQMTTPQVSNLVLP